MLAKAKQGNPARDEVIDLTDEEIDLLSKQFSSLRSLCSRFVHLEFLRRILNNVRREDVS